jgi:hypothetical protein
MSVRLAGRLPVVPKIIQGHRSSRKGAYVKLTLMKVLALYRPASEHARAVEEFVREFQRRDPSRAIELVDLNTRDGAALATLYDVVQYPAILALSDDGQLQQWWQGEQLPLMNEVAAYATAHIATKL